VTAELLHLFKNIENWEVIGKEQGRGSALAEAREKRKIIALSRRKESAILF
jgi:hypothetical protein